MDNRLVDQQEEAQAAEGEEMLDPTLNYEEEVESNEPETTQAEEIPSKFKDKSFEDVVDMYRNLEKEYGRKGNEVGELRKLTDELLQLEIQQKKNNQQNVTQAEEELLSDDDWFSSPKKATDKYLEKSSLAKEVQELKAKLANKDREVAHETFVQKHPDYLDVAKEPGFAEFVTGSKYRQELAQKADAYDYDAANELFDLYKTVRQPTDSADTQGSAKANQEQARKKATLEGSGNRSKGTKKVYRRADLIKMKMQDPERYMSMQDEIMQAYSEGRVK